MIDPTFLAWAAGFFDGEGSVILKSIGSRRHQPAARVTNAVHEALDALQAVFGGHTYELRVVAGRRPCFQWQVAGAAGTQVFLESVRPYLRVRGEQADVCLRYCALVDSGYPRHRMTEAEWDERAALVQELKALSFRQRPASTHLAR